ncbi:MAG TPA: Lrp/AsnC family transcriptional regulator [Mycobacteriales bacterium]
MEQTDRQIVSLLSSDGRMSYTALARATGLSVSAAHQRVRRLEERGVITGYTARIDHDLVGLPLTAFVALTPLDPAAPDDVPAQVADLAEVESCHSVAGTESYLLLARVAGPPGLEQLLAEIRTRCGMATRTTVVLTTPFEGRPPAIPQEPA